MNGAVHGINIYMTECPDNIPSHTHAHTRKNGPVNFRLTKDGMSE